MSYWKTIYFRGNDGHIHEDLEGRKIICYQKHGKKQMPYLGLTVALLVVELVLGFALILRLPS
jgi:hypothetical protein